MNIFRMRTKTLVAILVPVAILVLIGTKYLYGTKSAAAPAIPAEPAAVIDSITAIGTVVPKDRAELGFSRSGIVASIPYDAGARVASGAVLASLDVQGLAADLSTAESDRASAQAEMAKDAVLLANAEENAASAINDAYADAEDAVKKRLDPLFTDDDRNPQLSFRTSDTQTENDLHTMRSAANATLAAWRADMGIKDAAGAKTDLTRIRALLYRAQDALRESLGVSDALIASYKTEITAGLTAVNRSISTLNGALQAIRTAQADAALAEAKAGRAAAAVRAAQVAIGESSIRAPFSGTITARNFKPGEFAPAGQTALSLASDSSFEIETDIPEAYIAKIAIGHPVSILLDAYPDAPLSGTILSLDPAGKEINDVVYYRMKVSIGGNPKGATLKGGLTANVTITP